MNFALYLFLSASGTIFSIVVISSVIASIITHLYAGKQNG